MGAGQVMKSLQKSIVHICSCLICLGGHPYIRHDVTHACFYQKLHLDPHIDPHIVTICGHGNFQNWGQHIHACLYGVGVYLFTVRG